MLAILLSVGKARFGKACVASKATNPIAVQESVEMLGGMTCV